MSLTLQTAENRVRTRTRTTNDTTRLTQPILWDILNEKYRELRTELQEIAPTLYLCTSEEITLAAGDRIELTADPPHEHTYRVEKYYTDIGKWRPVERANSLWPGQHQAADVAWEERACKIVFHPEGEVTGKFRVFYHFTPSELADAAHVFAIPSVLEPVLIYRACAQVVQDRGDNPKDFLDSAQAALERVENQLRNRYGEHPDRSGLQEVLGY